MSDVPLGKVAYEAYLEVSGGRSLVTGVTLPTWEDQYHDVRNAWDYVADAVVRWHREQS